MIATPLDSKGFAMNWQFLLTTKLILGRAIVVYYMELENISEPDLVNLELDVMGKEID